MNSSGELSQRELDLLTSVFYGGRVYRPNYARFADIVYQRLSKHGQKLCERQAREDGWVVVTLTRRGCRELGLSWTRHHRYLTSKLVPADKRTTIVLERTRREQLVATATERRPAILRHTDVPMLTKVEVKPRPRSNAEQTELLAEVRRLTSPERCVERVVKTGKVNMSATICNLVLYHCGQSASGCATAEQVHELLASVTEVTHRVSYTRAYLRDLVRKGVLLEGHKNVFMYNEEGGR